MRRVRQDGCTAAPWEEGLSQSCNLAGCHGMYWKMSGAPVIPMSRSIIPWAVLLEEEERGKQGEKGGNSGEEEM